MEAMASIVRGADLVKRSAVEIKVDEQVLVLPSLLFDVQQPLWYRPRREH
jgi:hypothetical protein